jgi:photosystem II stability/assembly factor-like uncharacterized protein
MSSLLTRYASLALAALAFATSIHAEDLTSSYVWKPVRIGAGGWMRGMVIDPENPQNRLARSDTHGAFKWNQATGEWEQLITSSSMPHPFTLHPAITQAASVAMAKTNPQRILVALSIAHSPDVNDTPQIYGLRIFRSLDGGATFAESDFKAPFGGFSPEWAREGMDNSGETLVIDPLNEHIAFFCSRATGLWRSEDGGMTWVNVRPGSVTGGDAPGFLRFDPSGGSTMRNGKTVSKDMFLSGFGKGLFKSEDAGATWQSVSAGQPFDTSERAIGPVEVATDGTVYVAARNDTKVWRRSKAGTWTMAELGNDWRKTVEIAEDPNNPNRIFVSSGLGPLHRVIFNPLGIATVTPLSTPKIPFSDIPYLAPNPLRPLDRGLSVAGFAMDRTGRLWMSCGNEGFITTLPNDLTDTAENPPLWTVMARGIAQQVGGGVIIPPGHKPLMAAWEHTTFQITDPDRFDGNTIFNLNVYSPSIPSDPGSFVSGLSSATSASYCPTWPSYVVHNSADMHALDPHENYRKWAGFSRDGGKSWQLFESIRNGTHPQVLFGGQIAVSALNRRVNTTQHNIVWIPPYGTVPFFSRDGGKTWRQTASFDNLKQTDGEPFVKFKTRHDKWVQDASGNWVEETFPTRQPGTSAFIRRGGQWEKFMPQRTLVADQVRPGVFYYLPPHWVDGSRLFRSVDGGQTWQEIPGIVNQLPSPMWGGQWVASPRAQGEIWVVDGAGGAFTQGTSGIPASEMHAVYHTTDGGRTWTKKGGWDHAACIALGRAAPGRRNPAIYVYGRSTGDTWGIYRSIDDAATWSKIGHYPFGSLDMPNQIAASWDTFGLVYLSFSGTSFGYGKPIP